MTGRIFFLSGLLLCLLLLGQPTAEGSGIQSPLQALPPVSPVSAGTYFREEFDQPAPGPDWVWVNEQPQNWTLQERAGFLRIHTQPGTLDQNYSAENVLTWPAPPAPYVLTTRVEFDASADFHEAALLLYQDADNYIKLSRLYSSEVAGMVGAPHVYLLVREVNGQRSGLTAVAAGQGPAEMQLTVSSHLVTGAIRDSAGSWITIGALPLVDGSSYGWIGLAAHNGISQSPAPAITADFDFVDVSPFPAPICESFTEAAGGQGQFSVCDDAQVRFLSAFREWGLQRVGYPISRRYERDGFVTQAFQKAIMQWRPESQSVALVNIFDDLHRAGFDETLLNARQTPLQLPPDWDLPGASFDEIVQRRQSLLDGRSALREAYFSVSDPLLFFGLPTSEITDMGNHYAIRLQRTVLQEWKEDVPWARRGEVTIANGGDIAKELGSLPAEALLPEPLPDLPLPAAPPGP